MLAALHTSDGIALGAGIVAVLSLLVAMWSVTVSRRALDQTERQTKLAEAAERERLKQAAARAVMEADISPLILTVQASMALFRPLVNVRNVGDRDSGRAVVRVYMPAGQDGMAWDDEHTRGDRKRPIVDPDVKFYDANQSELQAQYIERVAENITPSMPVEFRVILPVAVPQQGQGRYRIPVRVVVRADHADEPFEWTNYVQTEYGPPPA